MVLLEVQDTGSGMLPEVLEKAVDPFFTTKPQGKGTGLGLAQVFNTVRAHAGQLNLSSRLGWGTCARITLPSTAAEIQAAPAEAAQDAAPGLDILFVDDDELLHCTVPTLLEMLGHRVRAADGGAAALEVLRSGEALDLMILDVNMPGMNGLQVLQEVRTFLPLLPVILATGYADGDLAATLRDDPCLRVTFKPFTAPEIEAQIREVAPLLERRRNRRP
jgi:CheY-like chemotaxis protein